MARGCLFPTQSSDGAETALVGCGAGRQGSRPTKAPTGSVTLDILTPSPGLSFPICKVGLKRDAGSGPQPGHGAGKPVGQAAFFQSKRDLYLTRQNVLDTAQGLLSSPTSGEPPDAEGKPGCLGHPCAALGPPSLCLLPPTLPPAPRWQGSPMTGGLRARGGARPLRCSALKRKWIL